MRWFRVAAVSAWVILLSFSSAAAQRREKGDERDAAKEPAAGMFGPDGGAALGAGVHPLMQALDADGDGILSAKEIRGAARALKALDTNRDGKLTPDELMPGGMAGMPGMGAEPLRGAGAAAPGAGPAAGRAVPGAGVGPGLGGFGGFGAAGGGGVGQPVPAGGAGGGAAGRLPGSGLPAQVGKLMGFDKNGDGRVTRDELPEELHPLFPRLDLNRDGAIDIREIRAVLNR